MGLFTSTMYTEYLKIPVLEFIEYYDELCKVAHRMEKEREGMRYGK